MAKDDLEDKVGVTFGEKLLDDLAVTSVQEGIFELELDVTSAIFNSTSPILPFDTYVELIEDQINRYLAVRSNADFADDMLHLEQTAFKPFGKVVVSRGIEMGRGETYSYSINSIATQLRGRGEVGGASLMESMNVYLRRRLITAVAVHAFNEAYLLPTLIGKEGKEDQQVGDFTYIQKANRDKALGEFLQKNNNWILQLARNTHVSDDDLKEQLGVRLHAQVGLEDTLYHYEERCIDLDNQQALMDARVDGLKRRTLYHVLRKLYGNSNKALKKRFALSFANDGDGSLKPERIPLHQYFTREIVVEETHQLTTYRGRAGKGALVGSLTLLPGEEREIRIHTWHETTERRREASSIFDSSDSEAKQNFEREVNNENSRRTKDNKSRNFNITASAKAKWGWGSAKIGGSYGGSRSSMRQDFSKQIVNAAQGHASRVASHREVRVETEYETTTNVGEDRVVVRKLTNQNPESPVTYVIHQINERYHSALHLVDLRIVYRNGPQVVSYVISELDELVAAHLVEDMPNQTGVKTEDALRDILLREYGDEGLRDYDQNKKGLIKKVDLKDGRSYLQFKGRSKKKSGSNVGYRSTQRYSEFAYDDESGFVVKSSSSGKKRYVPGVILATSSFVLPTAGTVVIPHVGTSVLDNYTRARQKALLEGERLPNEVLDAGLKLFKKLIKDGELDKALKLYDKLQPVHTHDK